MNNFVVIEKDSLNKSTINAKEISLTEASIVHTKMHRGNVKEFVREGNDLLLHLKNGEVIVIKNFFVTYEDVASDLVFEDDACVLFWFDGVSGFKPIDGLEVLLPETSSGLLGGWLPWVAGGAAVIGGIAAAVGGSDTKNKPPLAVDDSVTGLEDEPVIGNVLENDSDPDRNPLSVTEFTVDGQTYKAGETATIPDVGTIVINENGSYTFVPEKDWNGEVPTVTYTITDGKGATDQAELNIIIEPVNDDPVEVIGIIPNQTSNDADEDINVSIVEGFVDPDGDELVYSANGLPPGLTLDPNTGVITGKIDHSASQGGSNADGTYTVTVMAQDPDGNIVTQEFLWTVGNPQPEAQNDEEETLKSVILTVDKNNGVLNNDMDPDGDSLIVTKVNSIAGDVTAGNEIKGLYGTLLLQPDGSYTYTPDLNVDAVWKLPVNNTLSDTFTYTVTDSEGGIVTADLIITIKGQSHTPPFIIEQGQNGEGVEQNVTVYEKGLTDGSEPDESYKVIKTIDISALDGLESITINGKTFTVDTLMNMQSGDLFDVNTPEFIFKNFEPISTTQIGGVNKVVGGKLTYEYVLLEPLAHPENIQDQSEFLLEVHDDQNASNTGKIIVNIIDDVPTAFDDVNLISEDAIQEIKGNVILSTPESITDKKDITGADGAIVTGVQSGFLSNSETHVEVGGVNTILNGDYGRLTLQADGSYIYELDNTNLNVQGLSKNQTLNDVFTYTITDGDGDQSTATLTIQINGVNDLVVVEVPVPGDTEAYPNNPLLENTNDLVVFEKGLQEGSAPNNDALTVNSSFTLQALDGLNSNEALTLIVGNEKVSLSKNILESLTSSNTQTIDTEYGTIVLNGYSQDANGNIKIDYEYTLNSAPNNKNPGFSNEEAYDRITIVAKDKDGDQNQKDLMIKIIDDQPNVTTVKNEAKIEIDDTYLGRASEPVDFSGMFIPQYGADGKGGLAYSFVANNTDSGLIDTFTNSKIILSTNVKGEVEGKVEGSGEIAFVISVTADGKMSVKQLRPILHDNPKDKDESLSIAKDALQLEITVTDGDGDISKAQMSVGDKIIFKDDAPELLNDSLPNETFNESNLSTGSQSNSSQTIKTVKLPIDFGNDGAVNSTGELGLVFDAIKIKQLTDLGLKSGGVGLTYELSADGHSILAKADDKDIFVITLKLDKGQPAYTFEHKGALDHSTTLADGSYANIILPFNIIAKDADNDAVDMSFNVEIADDTPPAVRTLEVKEDGVISFKNADVNETTALIDSKPKFGTVVIGNDGTITYTPDPNYRGKDSFSYTVEVADGQTYTREVEVEVLPVADKPQLDANRTMTTPEDTPLLLELKVPEIKDKGGIENSTEDFSELLGPITLTMSGQGYNEGAVLKTGDTLLTPVNGKIQIIIKNDQGEPSDLHHSNVPEEDPTKGIYYLTSEQYQAITVVPVKHHHENLKIDVAVSSYEVNENGSPLNNVAGAQSKQTITVDVLAVTDDVKLILTKSNFETNEDTAINLSPYLEANFDDIDGSEQRSLKVSGLEEGTVIKVGSYKLIADSTGEIEIPYTKLEGFGLGIDTELPEIELIPPKDFSGDINGITIELIAQDTDSDSSESICPKTDSVKLNLYVNPVAGDVSKSNPKAVLEDQPVAFLSGIKVTDKGTGTEIVTQVAFDVPSTWTVILDNQGNLSWVNGKAEVWKLTNQPDAGSWELIVNGNTVTIKATNGTNLLDILSEFELTPPAHSSKDLKLENLKITSLDRNTVNGEEISSELTVSYEALDITVHPSAEIIAGDTDHNAKPDLVMNGNYIYQDTGSEDEWFALNTSDFNIQAPWANEDKGGEDTFALFTPYTTNDLGQSVDDLNASDALLDAKFQYYDGNKWIEVEYNGAAVAIPVQYLHTVKFKGPEHFKGIVHFKVQAHTVDYDEDKSAIEDKQTSGEAWLTKLMIEPVADQVTLAVTPRVLGTEDSPVRLDIRPTSDDPNENNFIVTIKGIPVGAQIVYDGVIYDTTQPATWAGKMVKDGESYNLVIENFDAQNQPQLIPPKDSNQAINLNIEAVSVDVYTYIDEFGVEQTLVSEPGEKHELTVTIVLSGVPDEPILELVNTNEYVEEDLDAEDNTISLKDFIQNVKSGETAIGDNSETITLQISGLGEGFSLQGAGPVIGIAKDPQDRVWVVTPEQIADGSVKIKLPPNYSGTVDFSVTPVVTENDNPSQSFDDQVVQFTVKPSIEATLSISSQLYEDQLGKLNLTAVHVNGDTNEYITAVRFDLTDSNLQGVEFYADEEGLVKLVKDAQGWYIVEGKAVNNVYVKGPANFSGDIGLTVQYKVADPSNDGTIPESISTNWIDGTHSMIFKPITDDMSLSIAKINEESDSHIELTEAGRVTVKLVVEKVEDILTSNTADYDGSEYIQHILVENVPEGIAIEGGVFAGSGQWILPLDSSENIINAATEKDIVFIVSGITGSLTDQNIKVTVVTKDQGANDSKQATVEWTLTTNFGPGTPNKLPQIKLSPIENAQSEEDVVFSLDQAITGVVDIDGVNDAMFDMTVSIRTKPEDNTFYDANFLRTEIKQNGEVVEILWTKTVKDVTTATAQQKVDEILSTIKVIPEANLNSNLNNLGGKLPLDVTVTFNSLGISSSDSVNTEVEIIPVTDPANISIDAKPVNEGQLINIEIKVSNDADKDGDWKIINGKLYLKLSDNSELPGTLTYNGNDLLLEDVNNVQGLPGGQYFIIDNVAPNDVLNLTYQPSNASDSGKLKLEAWVENAEISKIIPADGSSSESQVILSDVVLSSSSQDLVVNPSNTKPSVEVSISGLEHDGENRKLAHLTFSENVLADENEVLQAAFIQGLPQDFTVYYSLSADGSNPVLAINAGAGMWSLPIIQNDLPPYIAIQAPAHWSGTLDELKLYLVSGEKGAEPTVWPVEVDVNISPIADGVILKPTLSFGTAGSIIPINLNADVKDSAKVNTTDAHIELTTLQLIHLNDGEKVVFYINGVELGRDRITYDVLTKTHTLVGLTQDELNSLGMLHLETSGVKEIALKAWTQEYDVNNQPIGDPSDAYSTSIKINIAKKVTTTSDDLVLWSGQAINGLAGGDTVKLRFNESLSGQELGSKLSNIEVLDLTTHGKNTIDMLTVDQVRNMTDSRNVLTINGTNEDQITLASGWTKGQVDNGYVTYTGESNGENVTLFIGAGLDVSSVQPKALMSFMLMDDDHAVYDVLGAVKTSEQAIDTWSDFDVSDADKIKFSEDFFNGLLIDSDLNENNLTEVEQFISVDYDSDKQQATIFVDRDGLDEQYSFEKLAVLVDQPKDFGLSELIANQQIIIG